MLELFLVLVALYLIYAFIVYIFIPIILPLGGAAAVLIGAAAAVIGSGYAIMNYVVAVRHNINFLNWTWPKGDEPAKRSYFFGPGYAQLIGTIKEAFELNGQSVQLVNNTSDAITGNVTGIIGIVRFLAGFIFRWCGYGFIYFIGTTLCGFFGLVHAAVTTAAMLVIYILFSITWVTDHLYLLKRKIRSDCPVCKNSYLIPWFECPDCGRIHKKLVPGPYGIWKHRCVCGTLLPCTFMNGRSRLDAFCPCCEAPIVTSGARPLVFQLIGGSQSGKSVFLSAYFHQYLERLRHNSNLTVEIPDRYQPLFDDMERWYKGGRCPVTTDKNSLMYPVLISSSLDTVRQFSIYDIAGEMFDSSGAEDVIVQQQFHYCNGILFLIDPFSSGSLRTSRREAGDDLSEFSVMPSETVAENFVNYMIATGSKKANIRSSTPIAVLIAKSDVREVKREIGPVKINTVYKNNPELYGSLEEARDGECRKFLIKIGLGAAVNNLETAFANLHYFPVSAIGHSYDGSEYEPWGVTDAIDWMLPLADKELADLIVPPEAANG